MLARLLRPDQAAEHRTAQAWAQSGGELYSLGLKPPAQSGQSISTP